MSKIENPKKMLLLKSRIDEELQLISIGPADIEKLRIWKNNNRESFFFKGYLDPEKQLAWYENYKTRKDDYIFVVEFQKNSLGCLGFRILNEGCDIYNVILGNLDFAKKGFMSKSIKILCSYLIENYPVPITAKVLEQNPALEWYKKIGFQEIGRHPDYVLISLNKESFLKCDVTASYLR